MGKAEKWTTECERNSSRTAQCVLTQKIKMYPTKKLRKSEVQHKYGNYTQSSKRLLPSAEEHNQLFRWENFEFVLFKKLICVSLCCSSMINTPEVCLITSPLKQILFPVGCPCPSLNCVNLFLSEWAEKQYGSWWWFFEHLGQFWMHINKVKLFIFWFRWPGQNSGKWRVAHRSWRWRGCKVCISSRHHSKWGTLSRRYL